MACGEWTKAQKEILISTWRKGSAAAARAVSEVSMREGGPARNAAACGAQVVRMRARGYRIEGMSASGRGRLSHTGAGPGGSVNSNYKPENEPAARAAAAARTKRRKCLKCREFFDSEGPGNHVCPQCKKDNARRDASGVGL